MLFLFLTDRTRITDKSVRDLVKAYTADFEKHITPHNLEVLLLHYYMIRQETLHMYSN